MNPIYLAIIYFCWVIMSVFILARIAEDISKKYPSFMDKRWKRILWLLSCLLFIPLLLIPLFVLEMIREFISGNKEARRILNDLQNHLNNLFDTGKEYVTVNPQYQEMWKTQILPAIELANKTIGNTIKLYRQEELTPNKVHSIVQPYINGVIFLLMQIGALKKTAK